MKTTRFGDIGQASSPGSGIAAGPAGGDLGGSYPGPGVTGIQGTPVCTDTPVLYDVLTFNGSEWCPLPGGTLPGSLPWFNVKDYGAIGDGSTDDTAAVNLAIAAMISAGAGVLYFPAGSYKCTSALTTLSVPCTVRGDGSASFDNAHVVSEVAFYSTTAVCFTVSTKLCRFQDIAIANFSGLTVSAGAGVLVDSAYLEQRCDFENVWVGGFYDNIDMKVGAQWVMHGCMNISPVRYGVRIRNTVNADAGDWSISDCNFSAENFNSDAAIRIESSGGGKITNVKINMALDNKKYLHGIDLAVATSVATADLLVANCSIENVRGNGINITTSAATSTWSYILVTGCQIALGANTTGSAVKVVATTLGDIQYLEIANSTFATSGVNVSYAINLTKVNVAKIDGQSDNFGGGFLTTSGCTSVFDASGGVGNNVYISGVPSTGQVPTATGTAAATWQTPSSVPSFATPAIVLGTAAAAGAASTVIRSDSTIVAFDATVPTTEALGDAAATGSAATAARRDHLHGMPSVADITALLPPAHVHVDNVVFSGDGSTTAFELPAAPVDAFSVGAYVAGVRVGQSLSGTLLTTLTFDAAPASGTSNIVIDIAAAL